MAERAPVRSIHQVGTQRLSIILATPPGFNAGMAATELALREFLRRHDLESDAQCYRLIPFVDRLTFMRPEPRAAVARPPHTGIQFRPAFDEADVISASAARLFWADYLHMGIYLRELQPIVATLVDRGAADRRMDS